jgi:hypothetical protein
MSDFDDALRIADADIFAAVGDKGILEDLEGRRHIVQCAVEEDIEVLDDFGKVVARRDYLDLLSPPGCKPARGWKIHFNGKSWDLDLPQESAGKVQTWALRK